MRVEVLLERNSNVIVHEDARETCWDEDLFNVLDRDGDGYGYPKRNISWVKVIGGRETDGDND